MKPLFVKQDVMLNGIILGLEGMGAKFDKVDETYFYFTVKKGSEIDTPERIANSRKLLEMYGLGLKIRRVL